MSTIMATTFSSLPSLPITIFLTFVVYNILKYAYRITLHPLARFPGPKIAALSRLHAMSWDIPYRTSYVKEFTTYHDKYKSPVVRIEPNHLHFRDIDAYNEIFKVGTKFTRDPAIYAFPATTGSMFNELGPKEGTAHRALYTGYFSKGAVTGLEPVIREHLAIFLGKLDEASKLGKSVDLTLGFRCLMADTIMRYMYDRPFGALNAPEFKDQMVIAIAGLMDSGPGASWYGGKAFIWLFQTLMAMPRNWVLNEGVSETFKILDGCKARIIELSKEPSDRMTPNVFQMALNPNEKKHQVKLSINDMAADGLTFFTAGADTTSNALSFGLFNLIRRPSTLRKLREELSAAISKPIMFSADPSTTDFPLSWSALEKLPYLHAVIKESVRMSFGVPGKLPRVVPPGGVTLAGQFIPAGTVVSSASYAYFTCPDYYVAPEEFRPERWIPDSNGKWSDNNGVDPEKYFIAFARGSRSCIGINLAYAQMNYTLAYMIRNFDISLDEGPGGTKDEDMQWHDAFVVATFGHLKVKFHRIES